MSKTTWTEEQQRAIYENGSNILVSAGAGSGKTAVLTERILERLGQGISLEELVVLTFTNAAAFEMKERVRSKLKDAIQNGHPHLKPQLDLLDSAFICTFDSFSLSLVRKYHYLLGIEKNVSICDTIVLEMEEKKTMEEVFHSFFEQKEESFLHFMDTFSMKDSSIIEGYLLSFAHKLDSLYDKERYLNTYIEEFYKEEKIEKDIQKYTEEICMNRDTIFLEMEQIEIKIGDPLLLTWFEKVRNALDPLEKVNTYDDFVKYLPTSIPSLPSSQKIEEDEKEDIKENYTRLRKAYDQIKNLTSYRNVEEIKAEIQSTKESVMVIIKLLQAYETKLSKFKKENSLFTFSDIGRFGVQILEKYPDIRKEYQNKIKEIMIDEYQDTNDMGDYFISLIAQDNVYMVGDVKQSIYGFRNANPSIFMEKYDAFSKENGGIKIDLMKNFRSRKEVLDSINLIFEKIMDIPVGGADYVNGHEMIFGNQMYEKESTEQEQMVELFTYPEDKSYRKEEIEAFLIGSDIRKKIEEKYKVLDKRTQLLRPCAYEDFTILMDRKTDFDLYKKVFTYLKIPLCMRKEESFIESNEIYALKNIVVLLHAISEKDFYSSTFSHAFLSVARSFLFSYKDDEIFSLFLTAKEKKESLFTALRENILFEDLYEKLKKVYKKIPILSLSELVREIYETFGFYSKIESLENVGLLTAKLSYLLDVCTSLENMRYSLADFVHYLETASKEKLDVSFSVESDSSGAVGIMTIHKSKGLEFPVCYYAGLYKTFSKDDFKDRFLWNSVYGFVVPVFEEGLKDTIYKTLVKNQYYQKDVSEKIRLFYVALTRAKEKMILVSPSFDEYPEIEEKVSINRRLNYRSFKDIVYSIGKTLYPYTHSFSLQDFPITKDYEVSMQEVEENKDIKENPFSVSIDIQREKKEKHHFSTSTLLLDEKAKENMELGVQVHTYLENIPVENRKEFYQKYDVPLFFQNKIEAFFSASFLPDLTGAHIYREYEFVDEEGNVGIIDLLIETDDLFMIVDYKLREIEKESYDRQVQAYMKYIESLTRKRVEGYLYSILEEKYRNVANSSKIMV